MTRPALPLAQLAAMMATSAAEALEIAQRHHLPFVNNDGSVQIDAQDAATWLACARFRCPDGDV